MKAILCISIKRKPHIFFFWMAVSVKLWQEICGFTVFGGSEIETKGDFIETRGFDWGGGRRPPSQSNTPGFNEIHLWFSISDTPKTVKSADFLSKFHWIPPFQNKKNMWGFIWNLILVMFGTKYPFWNQNTLKIPYLSPLGFQWNLFYSNFLTQISIRQINDTLHRW